MTLMVLTIPSDSQAGSGLILKAFELTGLDEIKNSQTDGVCQLAATHLTEKQSDKSALR